MKRGEHVKRSVSRKSTRLRLRETTSVSESCASLFAIKLKSLSSSDCC